METGEERADRLAASDQGADHDHFCERLAGQGPSFPAESFTALLLMAIGSTMLTIPIVTPRLARLRHLIGKTD